MTVFTVDIDVRSTDIDSDGIVNNAIYLMYQEEGRVRSQAEIRMSPEAFPEGERYDRVFTLAETGCRYLRPVYWPARLVVETRLTDFRSRSYRLEYQILDRDSRELVAEGYSAQVWLDRDGNPAPFPENVRRKLEEVREDSAASRPWT